MYYGPKYSARTNAGPATSALIASWLAEESFEMLRGAQTKNEDAVIDATFDLLGLSIMALLVNVDLPDLISFNEWEDHQRARDRQTDLLHCQLMKELIKSITLLKHDDKESAVIDAMAVITKKFRKVPLRLDNTTRHGDQSKGYPCATQHCDEKSLHPACSMKCREG